jgi:hypothetical protein
MVCLHVFLQTAFPFESNLHIDDISMVSVTPACLWESPLL